MFSELAVGRIADLLPYAENLDPKLLACASQLKGKRRESFLSSRILLLLLLKKAYPDLTQLPTLQLMQYGKPYFPSFKCFFNITHSASAAIAYISDYAPCAVDLEFLKPRYNFKALKNKVLGPLEQFYFKQINEAEQLETFTALWTIRECVLKLSGRGLGGLSKIAIDLKQQLMTCEDNQAATIHCVRFDDFLDGKPCFCSYSEALKTSGVSLEERLVGATLADAEQNIKSSLAKPQVGFWQFKYSQLQTFEPPPVKLSLKLNWT